MPKALVLVDILEGIFTLPLPLDRPDEFLAAVGELLDRARAACAPIVHVQHVGPTGTHFAAGAPGRRIHPRVTPREGEIVVEKADPDAFRGSTLESNLRELAPSGLVLCGFATELCFDTTVRSAHSRGFALEIATDAHTTTANPVLAANTIVAHHNFVLSRFATMRAHREIVFD